MFPCPHCQKQIEYLTEICPHCHQSIHTPYPPYAPLQRSNIQKLGSFLGGVLLSFLSLSLSVLGLVLVLIFAGVRYRKDPAIAHGILFGIVLMFLGLLLLCRPH